MIHDTIFFIHKRETSGLGENLVGRMSKDK